MIYITAKIQLVEKEIKNIVHQRSAFIIYEDIDYVRNDNKCIEMN